MIIILMVMVLFNRNTSGNPNIIPEAQSSKFAKECKGQATCKRHFTCNILQIQIQQLLFLNVPLIMIIRKNII
jgi:hypothetical protein